MTDRQEPHSETAPAPRRTFVQRLLRFAPTDLIRLVFLCVLAGFFLAAFHVNPRSLWVDFFGTLAESWSRFIGFISDSALWAVDYLLLGAVLVVPIWIVIRVFRALRRD
tara:strand:+ start:14402 stop:14728 length:327 start_codon:yes stop_codon:yes gene_type:complete